MPVFVRVYALACDRTIGGLVSFVILVCWDIWSIGESQATSMILRVLCEVVTTRYVGASAEPKWLVTLVLVSGNLHGKPNIVTRKGLVSEILSCKTPIWIRGCIFDNRHTGYIVMSEKFVIPNLNFNYRSIYPFRLCAFILHRIASNT